MLCKYFKHREPDTKKIGRFWFIVFFLVIMDNKKTPKEFICEKCHLKCFKPSDYKRHLGTAKHKKDKKKHTNAYVEINTNIIQVYIVIRRSVIIIPPKK